jgi:hypothetical protein
VKIRAVGAELFRADGQADEHDDSNIRFSQFSRKRLKSERDIFYIPSFISFMFVITSCTLFITERLNENLQKRKE